MSLANGTAKRLQVLVADNTAVGRRLATFLLEKRGYAVAPLASTREVLTAQAASAADVILLDCNLIEPDIIEAAAQIRANDNARGRRTVLLAVSLTPSEDLERCLAADFDEVLPVPLDPQVLDEALVRLTGPVIDEAELLDRFGGQRKHLVQLASVLQQSRSAWEGEIDAGLKLGDAEKIWRAAHQMKGALGNLAARSAVALAKSLEELAKAGELNSVPALRTRLHRELARVESELARLAPHLS